MATTQRPADRLQPIGTGERLTSGDTRNHSTADAGPRERTDLAARIAADSERLVAERLYLTVRNLQAAELLDWRERLGWDVIDPGYADAETDGLARFMATEQLAAVEAELARRERVARVSHGVGSPSDAKHAAWADVARELRDAVPVPVALERLSHPMRLTGRDGTGREEYHGACPFCGGKDRFIAWGPPRSRYLCRQCGDGHAADVVTLWRNVTGCGFVAACEELLDIAGVPR